MTPLAALRAAVAEFEKRRLDYCLAGSHAASLYRIQERTTKDVDFALAVDPHARARSCAEEVIEAIGLKPMLGFIAGAEGDSTTGSICLVTSVPPDGALTGVIDILLPGLPWLPEAVSRAQSNRIDLHFGIVPVITPEDLIVAKCYAVTRSPERFQDLDDIKEIFRGVSDLDHSYISEKLTRLAVSIPAILEPFTPVALKRLRKG